ncbi:MAG: GGDEF domain-containing protein [Elainellaceae cyanobacterium]
MVNVPVSTDFHSASLEVLRFLHRHTGFDLWMVTRTQGNDWVVLQACDRSYGVEKGTVFRWSDSFCSRMVAGRGPRVAPRAKNIPIYRAAPIAQQVEISAYMGVPLVYRDGSLFGTLCAIHPDPQPDAIAADLAMVEVMAKLLGNLLDADLEIANQTQCTRQAEAEAVRDALTGLCNRRGWDQRLAQEEARCWRCGYEACIIAIDLDGLKQINDHRGHGEGDRVIYRAGQAMQAVVRQHDVVARVGGDEFVVLCAECPIDAGRALLARIRQSLIASQIDASLGIACRTSAQGLLQTWAQADQAMYHCKKRKKLRRRLLTLLA